MPDDKSLGKRILGLFVETPGDGSAPAETDAEGQTAADEIAAIAKQSAPAAAAAQPAAPRQPVAAAPVARVAAKEGVAPATIDFDQVFKNAGVDAAALDRVRKAEDLLKNLPDSAGDELKRQIVETSLKAFGVEISRIVEGVETQLKALDTYVRVNEQQTAKSIGDAQAQIAKLEDQVITLKAEIDKRTTALAGLAAAADVRKRQVAKVLEFFRVPAPTAGPASNTDE